MTTDEIIKRPAKRILLVECSRGAAAIYVVFVHLIYIKYLSIGIPPGIISTYLIYLGQDAVFLFFFLSGFSIHYSSYNKSLKSAKGICLYYYLRFRRIYPIFIIAVTLSIALGTIASAINIPSCAIYQPGFKNISFTLLFLTDWAFRSGCWFPVLDNNPALWSLSYEIPYYLVYPLFWSYCKKNGATQAFLISLLISGLSIYIGSAYVNHLCNVFSLYWMWTAGALMADWMLSSRRISINPSYYYVILFIFFAMAQCINQKIDGLTIALVISSAFASFYNTRSINRILGAGLIGILLIITLIIVQIRTPEHNKFLEARLFLGGVGLASLLIYNINISSILRALLMPLLKAGGISYALYIVHMPILYFLTGIIHYNRIPYNWMPIILLPVFCVAWWLEKIFQPKFATWLDSVREKVIQNIFTRENEQT